MMERQWRHCSSIYSGHNLVPRISPLHVPGSGRGETLVGAGHVSPREKLDPRRGPSLTSLCQDLLSTPKRGFRFAARSPRETHSLAMFSSSLHFASHCNINLQAKQVGCLEALYFWKDVVTVLPTEYGKSIILHRFPSLCYDKISIGRTAPSPSVHEVVILVSLWVRWWKVRSEEPRKETWCQKKKEHGAAGALF